MNSPCSILLFLQTYSQILILLCIILPVCGGIWIILDKDKKDFLVTPEEEEEILAYLAFNEKLRKRKFSSISSSSSHTGIKK